MGPVQGQPQRAQQPVTAVVRQPAADGGDPRPPQRRGPADDVEDHADRQRRTGHVGPLERIPAVLRQEDIGVPAGRIDQLDGRAGRRDAQPAAHPHVVGELGEVPARAGHQDLADHERGEVGGLVGDEERLVARMLEDVARRALEGRQEEQHRHRHRHHREQQHPPPGPHPGLGPRVRPVDQQDLLAGEHRDDPQLDRDVVPGDGAEQGARPAGGGGHRQVHALAPEGDAQRRQTRVAAVPAQQRYQGVGERDPAGERGDRIADVRDAGHEPSSRRQFSEPWMRPSALSGSGAAAPPRGPARSASPRRKAMTSASCSWASE